MMTTATRIRPRAPAISRAACRHQPRCPAATRSDALAAVILAAHPEQGWNLLCNGIITFDDGGAIEINAERGTPCTR